MNLLKKKVLVVGSGETGVSLMAKLKANPEIEMVDFSQLKEPEPEPIIPDMLYIPKLDCMQPRNRKERRKGREY